MIWGGAKIGLPQKRGSPKPNPGYALGGYTFHPLAGSLNRNHGPLPPPPESATAYFDQMRERLSLRPSRLKPPLPTITARSMGMIEVAVARLRSRYHRLDCPPEDKTKPSQVSLGQVRLLPCFQ